MTVMSTEQNSETARQLALGQDNSFGQPLETQARSTLLAIWLTEAAGLPAQDRDTAYWAAQLRYLGCTAHAHEVAVFFGDDIQTRARTAGYDASSPAEVLRDAIAHGLPERRGLGLFQGTHIAPAQPGGTHPGCRRPVPGDDATPRAPAGHEPGGRGRGTTPDGRHR